MKKKKIKEWRISLWWLILPRINVTSCGFMWSEIQPTWGHTELNIRKFSKFDFFWIFDARLNLTLQRLNLTSWKMIFCIFRAKKWLETNKVALSATKKSCSNPWYLLNYHWCKIKTDVMPFQNDIFRNWQQLSVKEYNSIFP